MGAYSFLTDADLQNLALYLGNPGGSDSERLFDRVETLYPALLSPRAQSQSLSGYSLRYYAQSNIYIATKDGRVYFYEANRPANGIVDLGLLIDWLNQVGL